MFGKYIKEQRENAGLTQTQVSKATGIPQNSISAWEKDKYEPSIVNCAQLADFYGITIDELIGREKVYKETPKNFYNSGVINNGNDNKIRNKTNERKN